MAVNAIEVLKDIVKIILPALCIFFYALAITLLAVSLNPDIKWNEYYEEAYPGFGFGEYAYYFNTLWSSLDAVSFETAKNSGHYVPILDVDKDTLLHDETWKEDVREYLYKALVLISCALFFLVTAVLVHYLTAQKIFATCSYLLASVTSMAGGICIKVATSTYNDRIPNAVYKIAKLPIDKSIGGYYFPDKEQMKGGYKFAECSAVFVFVSCVLILINIGLYIRFVEGKWICEIESKETTVDVPNDSTSVPRKRNWKLSIWESVSKLLGNRKSSSKTETKISDTPQKITQHVQITVEEIY